MYREKRMKKIVNFNPKNCAIENGAERSWAD